MKRVLMVVAVALAGCDDSIPGQCKTSDDCRAGDECYMGFCMMPEEADGGGTADSGAGIPDSGVPDGGERGDGGADASAPAPGRKWEAATCGSAYGDKAMENSRYRVVGSLSEPSPGGQAGTIEMKSSSHRCIGGFNAALHSK